LDFGLVELEGAGGEYSGWNIAIAAIVNRYWRVEDVKQKRSLESLIPTILGTYLASV
jgi:uncharacterized protein with NRDE domain